MNSRQANLRTLIPAVLFGLAFLVAPTMSAGQEIGAKEGDEIEATAGGKKSNRVSVVAPSVRPLRVEIVSAEPRPDESYGDWKLEWFALSPEKRPQVTARDYKVLDKILQAGSFRVRVTYATAPGAANVPVTMLIGPPTVVQPFPFYAELSDFADVYITPPIHLSAPRRLPMTVPASSGDTVTADVGGVRGSAAVVAFPSDGFIPDRGYIEQSGDKKFLPTAFERKNPARLPAPGDFDCSCRTVTLNRIVSRVYTGRSGARILHNRWHYRDNVEFQLGDFSNPPERGKVVIPWKKDRDVMQFYFTFPQALAFIIPDGQEHLCRVVVELKYPHPRRPSGDITETFRLYSKQGMAMATASRNFVGRTAQRDPKQKGPGRVRWYVEQDRCGDGVPFIIR